jgi:hypothetical protein
MAGLRTFTRSPRTAGDEATIDQPVQIKPPFREPPLDKTGTAFSDVWAQWFTDISDRVANLTQPTLATGGTTHTGTSTTDGSGVFTATWPAFPSAFGSLAIALTDPAYPGGIVAPTTVTLSSFTGTLSRTDNLYPTATSVVQAGVTFGWVVSGY